jgi:hypothetical protein
LSLPLGYIGITAFQDEGNLIAVGLRAPQRKEVETVVKVRMCLMLLAVSVLLSGCWSTGMLAFNASQSGRLLDDGWKGAKWCWAKVSTNNEERR